MKHRPPRFSGVVEVLDRLDGLALEILAHLDALEQEAGQAAGPRADDPELAHRTTQSLEQMHAALRRLHPVAWSVLFRHSTPSRA